MERPFSQASENNKAPILDILRKHFSAVDFVLEVGSGTGQHAVHFSKALSHLRWQPADRQEYIAGIEEWRRWAALDNMLPPLIIDVNQPWPIAATPAIFSANTVHIMSWLEVEKFFITLGQMLNSQGIFCLYGPFNYQGKYSSASNAQFDKWLKARDSQSGIRDFEAINQLAAKACLSLITDYSMPANNRCLVWQKK